MPTQPITFYDNYEAPLRAGSYRLVLQQTVTIEGEAPRYYYRDQSFEVLAPRYAIDADEIQAYFPPNGGVADYENVLPHVVLTARNLPWERRLWEQSPEPWLALLVVSDQEMRDGNVTFRTGTVADLAPQATGSVLLPNFKRTEDANTPVRLLDLDLALFRKLCPTRTELPLLAHIRRVEMDDKVPTEMVASGDFSVLVANRFPAAGTNNVYLISLEGWHELFEKPADTPLAASRLRLVTLGTWTFVNDKSGHDTFGGLMQQLKNNSALVGVTLPASTGRADVDQALKRGYVPLDYKPRDSTPAFAWYRGPLASATRKRLSETVFERADEAMIFDPEQGLLDVSYSSSWELGRLLALSSPAFVKGLRLFVERKQNAAELALEIKRFIDLHRTSFKEPVPDDPKPPQIAIAKDLVDWLARLVLLYPVPFHYLVPHQSLLPSESIRFFHLDDNWVDALLDGALSIAIRNLASERKASRTDLQSALSKFVYQYRLRLLGQDPAWEPAENYMTAAKSGFLLRSRIVSGWPGVEVTVKTNASADKNLPQILRFDEVAEGVWFCLARGVVEEVSFREPREGLTFGVGSDGKLKAAKSGKILDVKKDLLRSGPVSGVLNLAQLQAELATKGSAEFATQMIRKPEEQSITWS